VGRGYRKGMEPMNDSHIVHHQCGWCGEVTVHRCGEAPLPKEIEEDYIDTLIDRYYPLIGL